MGPWKHTRIANLEDLSPEEYQTKYCGNGHKTLSDQRDSRGSILGQKETDGLILPVKSLRDIVEEAEESPDWIIKDILKAGELTLLDGMAKLSGKTTFVMHSLKAIRDGEPFLGDATKRARILYLCEQGNNFKEAIEDAGLNIDDEGFKVVQWRDVTDVDWLRLIAAAVNMCKTEGREILICDTFAAFSGMTSTEENNSGDIKQKMEPLKRAANIDGLAVLTTRHSGKDGKGRGSSQFEAEADILVSLRRKDGNQPETVRELDIIGRYGAKRLNIDKTPDGYDNLGSNNRVAFVKALRAIRAVLPAKEEDALTEDEILTSANPEDRPNQVSRTTGRRVIEWLVEHGAGGRVGAGVRNDPFRYYLPPDPEMVFQTGENIYGQKVGEGEEPLHFTVTEDSEEETEAKHDPELFLTNDQPPIDPLVRKKTEAYEEQEDPEEFLPKDSDQPVKNREYSFVTSADELPGVLDWLATADIVGVDLETTGLDPKGSKISLMQLSDGETTYVLDAYTLDLSEVVDALLPPKTLIVHYAPMERGFIREHFGVDLEFKDTRLLARVLEQGDYDDMHTMDYDLAAVVDRYLKETLDKSYQEGPWDIRPLPSKQLTYAAKDAAVLPPLYDTLLFRIEGEGLLTILDIEERVDPIFRWIEEIGVAVDVAKVEAHLSQLEEEEKRLRGELQAVADIRWGSPQQLAKFFALAEIPEWPRTDKGNLKTGDEHLKNLAPHPVIKTLLAWRKIRKELTTYGREWLTNAGEDGRIHAKYDSLGTITGRTSCSGPNMQQIPHDSPHRESIVAGEGRKFVVADYSQIELRIAAKYVPDDNLFDIYRVGEGDAHTSMAATITGKPESEVSKDERNHAKAANFGPLYGMGSKKLRATAKKSYGVEWTEAKASEMLKTFKDKYPGLAQWHKLGWSADDKSELAPTRTMAGRRRRRFKSVNDWFNSPIQGTGADGAKLALALLHERRAEIPSLVPVLFVHDEIVVECHEQDAEKAKEFLERCMKDGMDQVLNREGEYMPPEVEAIITDRWEKP
jgi:DNA polymerase I